jgi:alpha-galactosidase
MRKRLLGDGRSHGRAAKGKFRYFHTKQPNMRTTCLSIALLFMYAAISAQRVSLENGWKFRTGDSMAWLAPALEETTDWKAIGVDRPWEKQGYANYDGFGWYRLHVTVPSSLRSSSFFKDSIRINLGTIDDGGEVYLNGKMVFKNYTKGDIHQGLYGKCVIKLAVDDPIFYWDRPNTFAVRVFDTGGDGGIYEGDFSVSMNNPIDESAINTDQAFLLQSDNTVSKKILLETQAGRYKFAGQLQVNVIDPETGSVVFTKTSPAVFSYGHSFPMEISFKLPRNRSYSVRYTFTDSHSGSKLMASNGTPYLLTPAASPKPAINGPVVYGARPGNPFLYRIPATGTLPLSYQAAGLPQGLQLDPATGIISGVANQRGDYPVTLTVANSLGKVKRNFTIKIGDGIALTPALGWNSWNAWGTSVDDQKVRTSAKAFADRLGAHGWNYVNIDDGWEAAQRAADGTIVPNAKFPDMKALADYVHGLGLKIGIYSSPGPQTCGGYLGSWQHETQDAVSYNTWGIDYLKYDWCSYSSVAGPAPDLDTYKKPYAVMREALNSVHRDIVFSFCQYGMGDVWAWGASIGGNSWRTTGDINDSWASMAEIGFSQDAAAAYARPSHFNDPDMLVVGNVGWGDNQHYTKLTPDEQYTHISLWSLLAAPLLIGCDLGHADQFTLNLLTNDEVLAVDQDSLGLAARQVSNKDSIQIWKKPLADGGFAVGLFNLSSAYKAVLLDPSQIGLSEYTRIRDLWIQENVARVGGMVSGKIPPHGVLLVKFSKG